jgi:hypothetical protein
MFGKENTTLSLSFYLVEAIGGRRHRRRNGFQPFHIAEKTAPTEVNQSELF